MKRKLFFVVFLIGLFGLQCSAQQDACPGWNNPTNFTATFTNAYGETTNCWSGKVGTPVAYPGQAPNVMTSTTGISLNSTVYSGNNLTTATTPADSWSSSNLPTPGRQFYINTTNGNDANVGSGLKYIPSATFNFAGIPGLIEPTNITSTVRIGDGYGAGQGQSIGNAAALYYELLPSVDNAILVLYYAMVVEAPGHGVNTDPALIIRVMEKIDPANPNSGWRQISDTMAYYITSTPANCSYCSDGGAGNIVIGQGGWHQTGVFYYKSWEKVVINLSDYIGLPTRIEVMVRDCAHGAHCAYAYIAGECRSANIHTLGCTPGMMTDVATLAAPRGMDSYEWAVSEYGVSNPIGNLFAGEQNDYFTFRTVATGIDSPTDSGYIYHAQPDDFRVNYRPNVGQIQGIPTSGDSLGNWQTFRCKVTSHLDPDKPYFSYIYANVNLQNPIGDTSAVACDSLNWYGEIYSTDTTVIHAITNVAECDSIVTLHLTINQSTNLDTTAVACDTFTWRGITYSSSGNYTITNVSTNSVGCDSTEILNLTLGTSSVDIINETTSGYFVWQGDTLYASGTYIDSLWTINGCDSIVILQLSILEGINNVDKDNIIVFPNPTSGKIRIDADRVINVDVYNANGQMVLSIAENNDVDISNLPPGMYTLHIKTPQAVKRCRIVRR